MGLSQHLPELLRARAKAVVSIVRSVAATARHLGNRLAAKEAGEMRFWAEKFSEEGGRFSTAHFRDSYTIPFEMTPADFSGKRILDIGCGPRGSLEWAVDAAERVGIDTLVEEYRQFGTDGHAMTYVDAGVEEMPFDDGRFDIVTSLNSLDHVEDIDAAINEITRVTKSGGLFLVIVEVDHAPTVTEPHRLDRDFIRRFTEFDIETQKLNVMQGSVHYSAMNPGEEVPPGRTAILTAKLVRH